MIIYVVWQYTYVQGNRTFFPLYLLIRVETLLYMDSMYDYINIPFNALIYNKGYAPTPANLFSSYYPWRKVWLTLLRRRWIALLVPTSQHTPNLSPYEPNQIIPILTNIHLLTVSTWMNNHSFWKAPVPKKSWDGSCLLYNILDINQVQAILKLICSNRLR